MGRSVTSLAVGMTSGFALTMAMAFGGWWPQAVVVPIVSTLGLMALKEKFHRYAKEKIGAERLTDAIMFLAGAVVSSGVASIAQTFERGF